MQSFMEKYISKAHFSRCFSSVLLKYKPVTTPAKSTLVKRQPEGCIMLSSITSLKNNNRNTTTKNTDADRGLRFQVLTLVWHYNGLP